MKLVVEREPFHAELRLIQGAIEKKAAIPTLSYFLMEARDDRLQLTASDMELSYQSTLPARVEQPGQVALPAKTLTDLIRSLPDVPLRIELRELPRVLIQAGRTRFEVLGLAPEDYPLPQIPPLEKGVVIPAWLLRRAIEYVDFVIPKHTLREAFLGMLLEKRGNRLSAAAMDIYRLAYYESHWDEGKDQEDFQLLIHQKALAELINVLAMGTVEQVHMGPVGNLIVFDLSNRRICIRMIEDTFPEYRSFIPQEAPYRLRVARLPLLEAFRRVVLLAKGTPVASAPSVLLEARDGMLELQFQHPSTGKAADAVEASVMGEPFPVYVNGEFLIEFLSAISDEEVELWFKSIREPAAVRPVGEGTLETYYYVYMPIAEVEASEAPAEVESAEEDEMALED